MTVKIAMGGDSITAGQTGLYDGPRQQVYDDLTAAALAFDFVGSATPPSSTVPDNACSAVGGYVASQIATLVESDRTTYTPHIITILAGINDANSQPSQHRTTAPYIIDRLLGRMWIADPTLVVLLGTITYATDSAVDARSQLMNEYIRVVAACHARVGRRCVLVETRDAYGSGDMSDALHPDAAGYAALGSVWSAAILAACSRWGLS